MATIITVSTNEFGTEVIKRLSKAFPDATLVNCALADIRELQEAFDSERIVILDSPERSFHERYIQAQISQKLLS